MRTIVPIAVFVAVGAVLYLGIEKYEEWRLEREVAALRGRTWA